VIAPGAESAPWTVHFQVHALPPGVPAEPGAPLLSWVRSLVARAPDV
jgi:hypothetical protein